jgi:hypothetical protein
MTIIVSFLVKLSFDIGHESPRQELNGGCIGKYHVCIKKLEFMCVYRELGSTHKEIRIGV